MTLCRSRYVVGVGFCILFIFFFKQKTAYEMRISDWSSDVCSSDLHLRLVLGVHGGRADVEFVEQFAGVGQDEPDGLAGPHLHRGGLVEAIAELDVYRARRRVRLRRLADVVRIAMASARAMARSGPCRDAGQHESGGESGNARNTRGGDRKGKRLDSRH